MATSIQNFRHPWFTAYVFTIPRGESFHSPALPRHGLPQVVCSLLLDGSVASIIDKKTGESFPHSAWLNGDKGSASAWTDSAVGDYVLTADASGLQYLCVCRKCETPWQVDFHDGGGTMTLPAGWVAVAGRGETTCGTDTHAALWCFGPFDDDRTLVASDDVALIGPAAA